MFTMRCGITSTGNPLICHHKVHPNSNLDQDLDSLLQNVCHLYRIQTRQTCTRVSDSMSLPGVSLAAFSKYALARFLTKSPWVILKLCSIYSCRQFERFWTYLCALDEPIIQADSTSTSEFNKGVNESGDRSNWLDRLKLLIGYIYRINDRTYLPRG
jgi:hypothetical protein